MALSHSPSRWSPYVSSPSRQRLPLKFRRKPTVLSGARSTTVQNSTPSDGTQESTSLKSFTFLENITGVAGTKPSGRVGTWTQNSSPERYSSSSVTDLSSPCLASSSPFQSSAVFSKKRKRIVHDRSQSSSKRLMTQELSSDAESDCTSETWLPAAAMNVERDYATMSPPSTPLRKRNRTTIASTPPFEAPKTQPIVDDFNGLDILASAACDNSVLDPVTISQNSSPPPSPYPSTPSKTIKRTRSPSTFSRSSDILDVKPAFNNTTTSSAVISTTSQAADKGLQTVTATSTPPPEFLSEPEVKADDLVQTLKPLELSHGPNNDSINVTKRKHAAAGTAQKASDDCGSSRSSGPQAKTGTKKNSGTAPSGSGLPSKTKVKPTTTSRSRKKAAPTAPSAGSSKAPSAPTVLVTPASDQHRRDTASSHNALDRDAITGAMVSSFAFGRATSLTAPDVTDSVFELLPNLKWGATKVEKALCHQILLDECRDILNTCPAFGTVERPGEDADGNPLEAMYHYEPQNDPDTDRAANLGGLSRRKRQSTKKHVQYHYAPVSLNRWETMAEEED